MENFKIKNIIGSSAMAVYLVLILTSVNLLSCGSNTSSNRVMRMILITVNCSILPTGVLQRMENLLLPRLSLIHRQSSIPQRFKRYEL